MEVITPFLLVVLRFVVVIGILILVHELGHFFVARWTGVGVERFSIGFGPVLLRWRGKETEYVLSAIPMQSICEPYIRRRAVRHMEKGRVVIFAAGTGNPFFTTDTAAALRASEMGCDALFKATKVDGVYTADPVKDPKAQRYEQLSYLEVLSKDLKVMDAAAISLARENDIPILVFSILDAGAFANVIQRKGKYTIIAEGA